MSKAIRTALSLVVSLVLLSALMMGQPPSGGDKSDKGNSKEHHSRVGKLAFWRHHKNDDSRAKAQATSKQASAKTSQIKLASDNKRNAQAPSKKGPAKTAQIKATSHNQRKVQASSKKGPAKASQVKAVSTKQAAGQKDQKQE